MIRKIGVLYQDQNSLGFLIGLKRRLKCDAELVKPSTGALSKSTTTTRRQAKLATAILQKESVDLILRFTDADGRRWQDVRRHEIDVFPDEVSELFICGVAVENVEEWLVLDVPYINSALGIDVAQIPRNQRTDAVKRAIARRRDPSEPVSDVTARIVAEAPPEVFRKWLKLDESLQTFYRDCRRLAARSDCVVPNELDDEDS